MLKISLIIGTLLIKMTILYSKKEYNLTSGIPKILLNIKENIFLYKSQCTSKGNYYYNSE